MPTLVVYGFLLRGKRRMVGYACRSFSLVRFGSNRNNDRIAFSDSCDSSTSGAFRAVNTRKTQSGNLQYNGKQGCDKYIGCSSRTAVSIYQLPSRTTPASKRSTKCHYYSYSWLTSSQRFAFWSNFTWRSQLSYWNERSWIQETYRWKKEHG
jgi:hypothetical protein